jgi:hypothetical protein
LECFAAPTDEDSVFSGKTCTDKKGCRRCETDSAGASNDEDSNGKFEGPNGYAMQRR